MIVVDQYSSTPDTLKDFLPNCTPKVRAGANGVKKFSNFQFKTNKESNFESILKVVPGLRSKLKWASFAGLSPQRWPFKMHPATESVICGILNHHKLKADTTWKLIIQLSKLVLSKMDCYSANESAPKESARKLISTNIKLFIYLITEGSKKALKKNLERLLNPSRLGVAGERRCGHPSRWILASEPYSHILPL